MPRADRSPKARKQRRRRRWGRWLLVLGALALAGGFVTWWLQRQATDLAAEIVHRAQAETPSLPEVPAWPLANPAALVDGAQPFSFQPDRATLVVLIHGMSPTPALDARVGSHAYTRHYWGHAFVRALLGEADLEDARGEALTRTSWEGAVPEGDDARDALVLRAGDDPPRLGAFLVTRDASYGLGEQVTTTAEQVTVALAAFEELAGSEAQLVLIGHSMGGLVARHMLVNPPVDDGPFGVPSGTREQIDRLRERTLYLVTLGTPHEGSRAADRALLLEVARSIIDAELIQPNAFARRWLSPLLEEAWSFIRLEDGASDHLRTDVWAALNDPLEGLLAAHRARRTDGSLVPVYALASRAPGGHFFVDPLVSDRIELELALWYAERLGVEPEAYAQYLVQMLLADLTMHALGLPERGWGRAADHRAPDDLLDRVTRVPTAPDRVAFGPEGRRVEIELASRADYLRGPHAGEVPTRGWLERLWCAIVRCPPEPDPERADAGSVDALDLDDLDLDELDLDDLDLDDLGEVDGPSVALVRNLVLGRAPPGKATPAEQPAGAVGDGLIDADGVVPIDSGLGLLLGGDEWAYLAAGREWQVGGELLPGSWYRPDVTDPEQTFPWTYLHHIDQAYDPGVARWIHDTLLGQAGPDPSGPGLSRWR